MRITWPDSGTVICHGATRAVGEAAGPSDDLAIDLAPGLIPRTYAGGGGPSHDVDGNDFATVAFSVAILCESTTAATALVSALILSTARIGDLAIDGGLALTGAGLTRLAPKQRGRRVVVSYAFAGRAVGA